MRIDSPESLQLINLNPQLQSLAQRRRRFMITTDVYGNEIEEEHVGDRKPGMFHSIYQWDIVPPVLDRRQRVWREGRSQMITLGANEQMDSPLPLNLPEEAWAFLVGGRALVTPINAQRHRIVGRQVIDGELDNAAILGTVGNQITIRRCDMEACYFYRCTFRHVSFDDCNFLKSMFVRCTFENCSFNNCSFQRTIWGDPDYVRSPKQMFRSDDAPTGDPASYNRITDCTVQGDTSGSRGFGPAPFFSETENNRLREEAQAAYAARQMNLDPREDAEARLKVWTIDAGKR